MELNRATIASAANEKFYFCIWVGEEIAISGRFLNSSILPIAIGIRSIASLRP
jgi:hypothetical protein